MVIKVPFGSVTFDFHDSSSSLNKDLVLDMWFEQPLSMNKKSPDVASIEDLAINKWLYSYNISARLAARELFNSLKVWCSDNKAKNNT